MATIERCESRLALGVDHTVVALAGGTGSGKSLCFFVPIIDTAIRARVAGEAARTRAIVVYPMNALANSQVKELDKFLKQNNDGWKAGVDGSVALATLGAGGELDTETAKKPIIGFIFSNKGLMYNLTFEGSKITKLDKDK